MIIYFAFIIIVVIAFNILYHLYLSFKISQDRNLILSRDYLEKLFEEAKSATNASQGKNSEIFIEDVAFLPEDFKIELNWQNLEQKLEDITK